jgi:hypothetical protein
MSGTSHRNRPRIGPGHRSLSPESDDDLKDFLLSWPPLPEGDAGHFQLLFETRGYRDLSIREVGSCVWRIKARPPENLFTNCAAKRDARWVVRKMKRRLLSPGIAARVGTRWATFVILLMPEDGVFPANEELLPERYRQPGPDDLVDEV